MFKRGGDQLDPSARKKAKVEDNVDDLWDDDLDDKVLNDCIKFAAEVCEDEVVSCTQRNNITLLPTYSAFKAPNILTSTQVVDVTSTTTNKTVEQLEEEIIELKRNCELKEGEVIILREQLKEKKVVNEWKDKYNTTQKDLKSAKSALEFKNLEIANLKQQINDLKKQNLDATLNGTQKAHSPKKIKTCARTESSDVQQKKAIDKIEPIVDQVYPLRDTLLRIFGSEMKETHIVEKKYTKHSRNTIPYLQNQIPENEVFNFNHKCQMETKLSIDNVYRELSVLASKSSEELKCEKNIPIVNRIVACCCEMLIDLQDYLKEFGNTLKDEDIQKAEVNHLKEYHSDTNVIKNDFPVEKGAKASQLINFLSEYLLYSSYLREYFCHNNHNLNTGSITLFPCHENESKECKMNMIQIILDVVNLVGKYRKASVTTAFLHSVTLLLISIFKAECYMAIQDLVNSIIKEIIFARPNTKVVCSITLLLKVGSHNSDFIHFMFCAPKKGIQIDTKNGLLHFNHDACIFYLFSVLFNNEVVGTKYLTKEVAMNMLIFGFNTFKESFWMHHRENTCDCIPQLYKLEVEIIYQMFQKYLLDKKQGKNLKEWQQFLNHKVTVKILNLLSFNNYEFIEKYITVYAQFKEVERILMGESYVNDLEKLSISSEEAVAIPSNSFVNIDF